MTDKIYTVSEIRDIVVPIAEKYGIAGVYLFGSYAKGCARQHSDIDLRIDRGMLRSLFKLGGLYNDLKDALDKDVDVVTTDGISGAFADSIRRDEVRIYGI